MSIMKPPQFRFEMKKGERSASYVDTANSTLGDWYSEKLKELSSYNSVTVTISLDSDERWKDGSEDLDPEM